MWKGVEATIVIVSPPKPSRVSVTSFSKYSPVVTIAITEAMPIITPIIVSQLLSLLALTILRAIFKIFPVFMEHRLHFPRSFDLPVRVLGFHFIELFLVFFVTHNAYCTGKHSESGLVFK